MVAFGISLAKYAKQIEKVILADISQEALEIAGRNARKNRVEEKIEMLQTNLWDKIEGQFDVIVSNPPYIPTDQIRLLAKDVQQEPRLALDGGTDGLDFYRKILEKVEQYLTEGGTLLCEIGYDEAKAVKDLFEKQIKVRETKLEWETVVKDLAGLDRTIIIRRK